MPFSYATVKEVLEAITSFNKKGDIDNIPTKFLKLCKNFIADRLRNLYNLCVNEGVYTDYMKVAKAIPVHEKVPRRT